MSDWRVLPLGDLVDIHDSRRIPLSKAERSKRPGPFPYYGAQGVIDHIDDFIFDGRYILVPEDGENLRSRKLPIAYFAEGKFWVNNHAHVISASPGMAVDRFIQSAIEASDIGAFLTGAAQPKLSQANLKRIELCVPDLVTQETIGEILDSLDDLIENNRRRIELLEEMAQAIYREWFVHFRFPGHEDTTLSTPPPSPIPDGWEIAPLSRIAAVTRSTVHPSKRPDETFRHYSIPAYDEHGRPAVELGSEIRSGKYEVIEPCVLLSKLNPRIPRTWFFDAVGEIPAVASTEFLVLTALPGYSLEHIYLTVSAPDFQARLQALAGGTTHQRAKPGDVMALDVVVPTADVADRALAWSAPSLELQRSLDEQNAHLASTRDLLLLKLVTGDVDVSQLDLDALVEAS